ncbi:MAG TPA: hypothetical protein VNO33_23380, partial [Kofleriaceae bacterium]|nr:hypothetical protein [Kofleriaceae bacterium]
MSLALVMAVSSEIGAQPPAARTGDAAAELQRAFAAEVGVAGGLTAAQAAERALVHSPSAAARREDVAIADSQLAGTRLEFLPRATLTGRYTRLSSTGDAEIEIEGLPMPVTLPGALEDQWSVGVQVAVPLSDY